MVDMKEQCDCWMSGSESAAHCKTCNAESIEKYEKAQYAKSDAGRIESLTAQLKEAREALAKAQEPDFFYDADNWEVTYHELEMVQDELDGNGGGVMRLGRLVALPAKYMIQTTNQETDDIEYPLFDTKEEAEATLKQEEL